MTTTFPFHFSLADAFETDALMQLKRKLEELEGSIRPSKKSWAERMEYQEENWQEHHAEILSAMITQASPPEGGRCFVCGEFATIHCIDCDLLSNIVCSQCDADAHSHTPFHRRSHWINGFYETASNIGKFSQFNLIW